ncbi:bifunctional adenosylcobinamide kinase/adenosylcobinamide-phosphate guanylyltransferase [Geomonas sp. Red32]|uniref:bifunctional adenosylcobinamide kinase/adenosylcobinamide-phosphate guanylyltransferase n=1 Tax=Geomonas sp. Red32 TaxID=2912856 RepID=UPI00202CB039|nr:bifunctional adenosylcobinamide kinase/adenosylcobinamide-phosphate guanylyltransferase [Geomonas sp. Red32]MCM0081080.1 bifunctional adenosylcobinamide kinase/adenosylcobinamide-phosphate guanylyltransferase [Geomonas sp. Red32]
MSKIVLVTGGARSGKSRFAEELAEEFPPQRGYLATSEARDDEMAARISRHRARRGDGWVTVEEPIDVTVALRANDGLFSVTLVDCITLWISNILFKEGAEAVLPRVAELAASFPTLATPLVIVTNEVGMGIVPEHPLARTFRDLAGEANEMLAAKAGEVYVTISGLPLKLKG